jgi:hypothetical protein
MGPKAPTDVPTQTRCEMSRRGGGGNFVWTGGKQTRGGNCNRGDGDSIVYEANWEGMDACGC